MNQHIYYFDNSASTKIRPEVLDSMMPYLKDSYGNPSSIYSLGRQNKKAIDCARDKVANALGADSQEIYFTGSGTEADNWAIKGIATANKSKGNHIIVSNIEHHAILKPCEFLQKHGFKISYLPVKENGIIDPEQLRKTIRKDTILISIMFANNEIGTIQPIKEIGQIAKEKGIYFHTDAVQAVGHIPINVKELNIDLLSMSGHKINGPKGVGVLYIKNGVKIDNLIHGGSQERNRRASTENVAGIVGLGTAIEIAVKDLDKKNNYLKILREKAIEGITSKIPYTIVNGDREKRLSGNVNICFKYIEGESILLMLDQLGICASSGSACTSGSLDPSHVLLAIGLPHEIAHGSLRLSFSTENTKEEVDYLLEVLPNTIERLRGMSPLYNQTRSK